MLCPKERSRKCGPREKCALPYAHDRTRSHTTSPSDGRGHRDPSRVARDVESDWFGISCSRFDVHGLHVAISLTQESTLLDLRGSCRWQLMIHVSMQLRALVHPGAGSLISPARRVQPRDTNLPTFPRRYPFPGPQQLLPQA